MTSEFRDDSAHELADDDREIVARRHPVGEGQDGVAELLHDGAHGLHGLLGLLTSPGFLE
jgi:hypothetical protein